MVSDPVDELDRRLLDLVQADARLPNAELGAQIGLSASATHERLRKLQARGVICGYGARVDPKAVGLGICAFLLVAVDRPEHEAPFRAAVAALPEVQECHHVAGEYSYLLKLRVADTDALERFIMDKLKRLEGVARSHSMIVLSTQKETPALACSGGEDGD